MPRPAVPDSRWVALQALLATDRNTPVQAALDCQLKRTNLSPQDSALTSELVYGVLRTRIALDAALGTVLANPRKLPPAIRHVLAIGLYSLRYAERIPAHAALDTAVSLARRVAGQRMGNLVNACLRKLSGTSSIVASNDDIGQRKESATQANDCSVGNVTVRSCDVWEMLGIGFALPPSIVSQWRRVYGDANAIRLMRRSFSRPWTCVRVNSSAEQGKIVVGAFAALIGERAGCIRIGQWGFAFAPGATPQGLVGGQSLSQWQAKGVLSFQAAGSLLVMDKLGLYSLDGPFWDCCCGVGGKSLALLERGKPVCLASDTSVQRLQQLAHDCQRLSIVSPETMVADASAFTPDKFDGNVLVDAPCSSIGVLARRPDVKKRDFSSACLGHFVQTQRAILDNVAHCICPGRHIAYMTCTLNPDENEGQIRSFLDRHGDFVLQAQWQTPHDHPWLEGMYGALLRRRSL